MSSCKTLEATCGNGALNEFPMTHLHSMVYIVCHSETSGTISGLIEQAKPIKKRQGEKKRKDTTGTRRQSPERFATKVVYEISSQSRQPKMHGSNKDPLSLKEVGHELMTPACDPNQLTSKETMWRVGGGIMEEKSWRRNHGGEIMEEK